MSKHTPGPWGWNMVFVSDVEEMRTQIVAKGDEVVLRPMRYRMRLFEGNVISVSNANARLISAAPELLEACKHVRELLQLNPGIPYGVFRILKNAIDKAEGKDSAPIEQEG